MPYYIFYFRKNTERESHRDYFEVFTPEMKESSNVHSVRAVSSTSFMSLGCKKIPLKHRQVLHFMGEDGTVQASLSWSRKC
jgi:hypothetical protein